MLEIVPYLPQFGGRPPAVKRDEDWRHPDNAQALFTLVPQFLDARSPESSWWVSYPRLRTRAAATHFVGVAGIGLDAAEYLPGDPATAKLVGVFGYDRETQLADIKDGPKNTIAVLQVPADFKRPWLAGGGSTVQGVPEVGNGVGNSVRPFVCTRYKDRDGQEKDGTFAIMADGKVRFIPADIPDKDFKALCTINGGEPVDVETVAPEVPAPKGLTELKPILPVVPPAKPPEPPPSKPDTPPQKPKAEAPKQESPRGDVNKVLAALTNNCAMCHTGPRAKGKVQIFTGPGTLNPDAPKQEMGEMLASGKMPPKGRPRPSAEDLAAIQNWLRAPN
jgi:hypothetical protein